MSPEERLLAIENDADPFAFDEGFNEPERAVLIKHIRAAEADARREALEEAAKLADETELIPLQGVLAKSKSDADYSYWVAEGFQILARRIRALASQKGTK